MNVKNGIHSIHIVTVNQLWIIISVVIQTLQMVEFGVIQRLAKKIRFETKNVDFQNPHVPWQYCSQIDSCGDTCQDITLNNPGWNYHGTKATTISGYTCQKWSDQWPHSHSQPAWNHNYCRNPDSEQQLWCYTTDPNNRWDWCNVDGLFLYSKNKKTL